MKKKVEVIYDIETTDLIGDGGVKALEQMGISIISAYRREVDELGNEISGEMKSFFEKDFDQMWSWFEEADRVIGYNSLGFDNHVMNGKYSQDFHKLKHFDVLEEIRKVFGHRVKLDSVTKESLGIGKNASGLQAVEWWKKGDPESLANLQKYCEMDVEVTTKVYDFARKNGKLKFKDRWNEMREIEVDFSYPPEVEPEKPPETQMGLF